MSKAKIIVIDGGDNVGKATQADLLVRRLGDEGVNVGKMDFPRYNQNTFGQVIKELLDGKRGDIMKLDPKIVATLFAADRYESKKELEEWIREGRVILLDRYVTANMLHQGAKIEDPDERSEFFNWLEHVEYEIFGMPRPDLTVYLEVPPNESEKLLEYMVEFGGKVVDPMEADRVHQAKVVDCAKFLSTSRDHWSTVQCLKDGNLRTREDIHEEIYNIVKPLLA